MFAYKYKLVCSLVEACWPLHYVYEGFTSIAIVDNWQGLACFYILLGDVYIHVYAMFAYKYKLCLLINKGLLVLTLSYEMLTTICELCFAYSSKPSLFM
jgi:hypothetical protein